MLIGLSTIFIVKKNQDCSFWVIIYSSVLWCYHLPCPAFPFLPFSFLPQTQNSPSPPTSIPDKWDIVQGAVLWQVRLCRSVIWGHRGLPVCSGALPFERGALLQGPERLLGILWASQLPWSPVLPGKGWISQACGLGRSLSHRAVLPPPDRVTLIKQGRAAWL